MTPEEFVKAWEAALATQDWSRVEPLVHPHACVTFSNGTSHRGREAVQAAFTRNFQMIQSEQYRMSNLHWVRKDNQFAVYLFEYEWKGLIDNQPAAGAGRGTQVLIHEGGQCQLLAEHLGPKAG
jgi:ketosteroid isomerase-like protein